MSLLGTPVYANPSTPLWASSTNPVFSGVVYAGEFQTTGGGDIVLKDISGNTALRLATGSTAPSPAYLQTNTNLYFGQVGQGTVNTTFTPSSPGANTDTLLVGGAIRSRGAMTPLDPSGNPTGEITTPATGVLTLAGTNAIDFKQVGAAGGNTSITLRPVGGQDILTTGIVDCDGITLDNSSGAATVGTATLSAGTVTVSTTASDSTCYIFLQRRDINSSTAIGELRITQRNAGNFVVVSASTPPTAPTTTETGDLSTFDWMIINPT